MQVKARPNDRIAILLDGGFVRIALSRGRTDSAITSAEVVEMCQGILEHARLRDGLLYRVFYYDAMPFDGTVTNPMDGFKINYKNSALSISNRELINGLEQEHDFAVRRGVLLRQGWKIKKRSLMDITQNRRAVAARDLVPDFKQKGVDLRIGLDMAQIALKRLVEILVLVTGDSDFVPVMKFARTEGLKVYLATLGRTIRPEMRSHADCVLS
jgi:uncharacterized LabA/DUF88 family protein